MHPDTGYGYAKRCGPFTLVRINDDVDIRVESMTFHAFQNIATHGKHCRIALMADVTRHTAEDDVDLRIDSFQFYPECRR